MKSIRKIVSLTLAMLLLCSPFVSTAFANGLDTPFFPVNPEEDEGIFVSPFYYSFDDEAGEATVLDYGGWNSEVVVPENVAYSGKTYEVTAIGPLAFTADNTVYSITLSLNIKAVAGNAFKGCTSLTDVWYEGSETDQNGISIGSAGNSDFTDATWHYSACIHNPASQKMHAYSNACDVQCNYCDQTRTVPDHVYNNDKDITCNECGYMRIVPGDVDEDNKITSDDALYFLYHYFFPEYYPINVHHEPDYDKDGDVDLDDVFYLLYHFYFPERFTIEIEL